MQTCLELQQRQQQHDEGYHKDVLSFDQRRRIAHMLIHFSKYVGRLAELEDETDIRLVESKLVRTLSDAAIVALALANTCGIDLSDVSPSPHKDLAVISKMNAKANAIGLGARMARVVGRMSKAYDDMDHDPSKDCVPVITVCLNSLITSLVLTAYLQKQELEKLIRLRWQELERP